MSGRTDHEKRLHPAPPIPISEQMEITTISGVAGFRNAMTTLAAIQMPADI